MIKPQFSSLAGRFFTQAGTHPFGIRSSSKGSALFRICEARWIKLAISSYWLLRRYFIKFLSAIYICVRSGSLIIKEQGMYKYKKTLICLTIFIFPLVIVSVLRTTAAAPNITIDASSNLGPMHHFWAGFGIIDLHEHLQSNSVDYPGDAALYDLVADVNQRVPGTFIYLRFFDLLSDDGCWPNASDCSDRNNFFPLGCVSLYPERDFTYCDRYFDQIVLEMGMKPLAILGYTPQELASIPNLHKGYTGGNCSPPNDYDEWSGLVEDVAKHFQQRYGNSQVESWIWEVWNEPDLFGPFWVEEKYCGGQAYSSIWPQSDRCWTNSQCASSQVGALCLPDSSSSWFPQGDMLAYTQLYDHSEKGIKTVNPNFKIAGPATAGLYIEPLLMHLGGVSISGNSTADTSNGNWTGASQPADLDYITTHCYAKTPQGVVDYVNETWATIASIDFKYGTNFKSRPIVFTEFSPDAYSNDWYQTRYPAVWLAASVDAIFENADAQNNPGLIPFHVNYLTTPVANDFGDAGRENDGLASNINGGSEVVKLPIFNAFEALGYLNGTRLKDLTVGSNLGTIASKGYTQDGKQVINVVVYNIDSSDTRCEDTASEHIDLQINDLPFSSFIVEHYRMDSQHGDSYQLWKNDITDISTLQSKDDLTQITGYPKVDTSNGNSYTISFDLPTNSFSLIRLISTSFVHTNQLWLPLISNFE